MYNIKLAGLDTGKTYYVKVRAKAFGYETSEWSIPFKFETPMDTMPPGKVENVSFISEGDSFIAKWDAPSVNEDGVTPCGDVSHYKITLKDLDRNVTRHEKTNDTSFTLDFNRNKELFGNVAGRIELTVWAVDFSGNEGKTVVAIAQNPPPAKVKNATAAAGVESIALKWDANTENDLANYEVHVDNTAGFTPSASTLRARVAAGTDSFTYDTASLSALYFKILAVDKFFQKSEPSDVVSAQPRLTTDYDKEPPGAVTGFTVTQVLASDNATATAQINYSAVADDDLDKYEVQYRKTGETTLPWSFATIPSDQTTAEIKPLPLATSYDFRIRAVDFNSNKGAWSSVVVAPGVKKTTLPAAPTGVTVRGGTTNLMVTWNASTDPSMASWAGTYEVQISKATTFTSPITIKTASTLASFISLDANTIYYVRIRSIDPYGNIGAWSTRGQGNTGQALDPLASRIYWADTAPTGGRTNDVWIKIPENVQYRFDGTDWIKAQDTELSDEIDNVRQTADGKNKAWYQTTKPPATNNTQGDLWFDTDDGNKLHVWSTSANDWVSAQDAAIKDALDNADEALQTADGKNTIFYSTPAAGAELREGDTWFDNAVIKVYKNGAWVNASDDLDTAKARQAIQIAGSKNKTYYVAKDSATGMIEGDILFDTAEGNKQYRYNGTAWVAVTDAAIEAAEEAAGQAQETADKKNTIYYSTPPTTGVRDGDTWFDGPTIKTYRNGVWTDSSSNLETQQGADAIQIAGSRNKTYYTTFANRPTTDLTEGDLLFDTGNKYKQYRYTNAGWLSVQDGTIADAKTAADNAKAAADTANQAVGNLAGTVGDLTTQVDKKVEVTVGGTRPSYSSATTAQRAAAKGDMHIDTETGLVTVYSGVSNTWNDVKDPAALQAATDAATLAGKKVQVFGGETVPIDNTTNALQVNDLWIRDSDKKMHRWTGDSWEIAQDQQIAANESRNGDLVINGAGSMGDATNWPGVTFYPQDSPDGARGSFLSIAGGSVISEQIISINPNKKYMVSVQLKSLNADMPTDGYVGLYPYDAEGLAIRPYNYAYQGGTTTALAEDLRPGDSVVKLVDSANWIGGTTRPNASAHQRTLIFWNYVDGFGKEWPTHTYSRNIYSNVYSNGGLDEASHTITLDSPWSGPLTTAGTAVSNGMNGSNYMYLPGHGGTPIPNDKWITRSGIIGSTTWTTDQNGRNAHNLDDGLPPGTAGVKLILLLNHSAMTPTPSESRTLFANVSISDAAAAYDHATTAIESANARNRNIYSTGNATGGSLNGYSFIDGDTWYKRDANDTIVGMWEFANGSWVSKTLNNQVIANLDAGKINAGTISADRIGAKSIETSKIAVGGLDASVVIEDGTITTEKVHAEAITASELAAGAVTADKIKANEIDASKIVSGGMDGSVVIEEGTITATEIAGKTITGDKIQGNTIDATHIVAGSITIGAPDSPLNPAGIATPSDVSTAKSEAISTASGDATAKANAAQAAAIQAAATDAQTKADNAKAAAEQAAKDYADGQITQAEADAIAAAAITAQEKADTAKQAAIDAAAIDAKAKADKALTDAKTDATGKVNAAVLPINTKLGGWSHPTNQTFIDGGQIFTDSITAGQIAADAISTSELQADAVEAYNIRGHQIDASKIVVGGMDAGVVIEENTITADQILGKTITSNEIKANTITVGNMGPGSVDNTVIQDGAITTKKILAGEIKAANIDSGAITADKIEAGAITIGGTTGHIPDGAIAGSGEVVPKVTSGSGANVYRDLATNRKTGSDIPYTIIRTPITITNHMFAIRVRGYSYLSNSEVGSDVDFTLSGYAYSSAPPLRIVHSALNNKGGTPVTATFYITDDPEPKLAIIAEAPGTNGWRFPQLTVSEASISGVGSSDFSTGWSIEYPDDISGLVGNWTAFNPGWSQDQATTSRIADGWIATGTTEINGGKIKTDTIEAGAIKTGSITIGPKSPIAPGTISDSGEVITPTQFATEKTGLQSYADDKASDAKDQAISDADGKFNTVNQNVTNVKTTADGVKNLTDGWKYGNTTYINGGNIYTDTITAAQIASKVITAEEIKGETITATELAADSVIAGKIAADAVKADNLEANMIVGKNLQVQSALTINAAGGHIKSSNYNDTNKTGFYMDQQQLIVHNGRIEASAIKLQDSANIMPPLYASFNARESAYAELWTSGITEITKVAGDGIFGGDSLQVVTSADGFLMLGKSGERNVPIEGGQQYILSFYVSNRASKAFTMQVGLFGLSGAQVYGSMLSIANTTAWTRHSVVVTAPVNMSKAVFRLNTQNAPVTFRLDGIQVERKIADLDTPSNWSPPGYTSIDGESITTGAISSNSTISTPNGNIARWSIDTAGKARFADATIDGKLVVGADVSNKEATSIQSDTYSAGLAGWAIKGNGDVEFNNGTFRGMLSLEKAGVDLTMSASVSTIDAYIDTDITNFKPINTANIRGTTYGYKREIEAGSNVYMPTEPDPSKFAHFFIGPTTEKALNLQVHDGPEQDNIYLSQPPNNITLTSINLGEQTSPNAEPSFRENQGVAIKTYRNEARDYNFGGQQTGGDLNITSSTYELLTRERSAVIPEIAVGESEYPQAKQEWTSTSIYETPKAKNIFPSNFVRGGAFAWTGFGNPSIASVVKMSGVGQFGLGTHGHSIYNAATSAAEVGFDMTVNVPTAGPHIVSFYVNVLSSSGDPMYVRVAENSASFIANEGVSPAITHATFGVLGPNHTELPRGTVEKRVSFYINSLAAGTRTIRFRFYMGRYDRVDLYKPQLERAAFRDDDSLPAEIRQSYLPTPWTENDLRSSSNVSFRLQAEPIVDPLEFEGSIDSKAGELIKKHAAEAVLSFSAESQSTGPQGYQSTDAEFKFSPMGMTFPGTDVPYLPTGVAIDYDFTGPAYPLDSRPAVGGSTSGVTLRVNSHPVRVNNGKEVRDPFPNDISGSRDLQIPGWDIRNQAAEDVVLRVYSGSLRSSESNNYSSASGDGLILARKTTKMSNTDQSVTVTMLRLVFPFLSWQTRGGPVINIDPATGARIVAYFDYDENIIRVIRYSSYTAKAATILTAPFTWSGTSEFTLTLSRSGDNITLLANGNVLGTATNQSNLPNGLYTGISPRSGSFRNFIASDGGDSPGAPGELPHAINVNNGRGLTVNGADGSINVSAPGFYHVSMYLFPDGKFGTNSSDHFQIMVYSDGKNHRMSPDLTVYGDGVLLIQGSTIAYLTGQVDFNVWSNDGSVNRLNKAEIRIVRMA